MALIRSSTRAHNASATSLAGNAPSGATSGDELYAFVFHDSGGGAISADVGGWTELQDGTTGTSQVRGAAYHRTLSAAPDATYSFTSAGAAAGMVVILVAVNPNGDTFASNSSTLAGADATTTSTVSALTGVADPSVILVGYGADDSNTIATPPAGYTALQDAVDGAAMEGVAYGLVNPGTGSLTPALVWGTSTDVVAIGILADFTAAGGGGGGSNLTIPSFGTGSGGSSFIPTFRV